MARHQTSEAERGAGVRGLQLVVGWLGAPHQLLVRGPQEVMRAQMVVQGVLAEIPGWQVLRMLMEAEGEAVAVQLVLLELLAGLEGLQVEAAEAADEELQPRVLALQVLGGR